MKNATRRFLAYGSNATLVTVLVLGVLVLLYVLADHSRAQWDLSAGTENTLQSDTMAKLRILDAEGQPVQITAFTAQAGKPEAYYKNRAVRDLLGELDDNSTQIQWRQVDYDQERLTAEKLGVTQYGQIVVQRGSDRVDIKDRELFKRQGKVSDNQWTFLGEAALDRALSQILTPKRRVVYVLTGHGDLDPEEQGPDGLSHLADVLDEERYEVQKLDLMRAGREGEAPDVPADAAVVFVARPEAVLTPQEEDVLLAWLGRGSPILFAVDIGAPPPPLLSRMGVQIPEGMALDTRLIFPYRDRPEPVYKSHPIVEELRADEKKTVLAAPASVSTADPAPPGLRYTPVLTTSRDGWIDRGGSLKDGLAIFEPDVDIKGPVNLAVAVDVASGSGLVRAGKPPARVFVAGDADMFTNALMDEGPGNEAFAVNTIHWLAGEEARMGVGVTRKRDVRRLALTEEEAGTIRWLSLGLMPGLVALAGLLTWWTRRGR